MKIKHMDIKEFREIGFLQEANRQFFHPLGLALEITTEENGIPEHISGVWDYRGDPEGVAFADDPNTDKIDRVDKERFKHEAARKALFNSNSPVQTKGTANKE